MIGGVVDTKEVERRGQQTEKQKVAAQLKAAHETIDVLRGENAVLYSAALDTLRFHDDCMCRHGKKFLLKAVQMVAKARTQQMQDVDPNIWGWEKPVGG
jgi:hypothetical protein